MTHLSVFLIFFKIRFLKKKYIFSSPVIIKIRQVICVFERDHRINNNKDRYTFLLIQLRFNQLIY